MATSQNKNKTISTKKWFSFFSWMGKLSIGLILVIYSICFFMVAPKTQHDPSYNAPHILCWYIGIKLHKDMSWVQSFSMGWILLILSTLSLLTLSFVYTIKIISSNRKYLSIISLILVVGSFFIQTFMILIVVDQKELTSSVNIFSYGWYAIVVISQGIIFVYFMVVDTKRIQHKIKW